MKISKDAAVSFHYTLTDQSGEVLDTSSGREPLTYLHGHDQIIPGLERQLEGLQPGDRATLAVPAAEGYGEVDRSAVFEVSRDKFPADEELIPGTQVMSQGGGEPRVFTIREARDDKVVLDANHPMAGKDLNFAVEVTEVRPATPEEIEHGHVHDGSHHH
ncbi:MAG: FKBP-type peptidyl-prolyl cis-trans isomerase [Acidobacteriota bacterium]